MQIGSFDAALEQIDPIFPRQLQHTYNVER
jgi:hypothetical protein